jgi:hypothetical protein
MGDIFPALAASFALTAAIASPAAAEIDRYGGEAGPPTSIYTAYTATGSAHVLTWSGKTAPAQPAAPAYAPPDAGAALRGPLSPPNYTPAAYARPAAYPPQPTSIYAAPQAPAQRQAPAPPRPGTVADNGHGAAANQGPKFYSVHREFGIAPDPAPIPPQFFTATADLSQPPPPVQSRRTVTTNGVTRTVPTATDTPDGPVAAGGE